MTSEEKKDYSRRYRERNLCRLLESRRAYYRANKEKQLASNRAYYEANKEKVAQINKAWRSRNKDRAATSRRAYYEANREARNERARARHRASPERSSARGRTYYAANREKVAAVNLKWRLANPEKNAALVRAWHVANPEKRRAQVIARRVRKLGQRHVDHKDSVEVLLIREARDQARLTGQAHHLDHVIPLILGGWHHHENLQVLPGRVNKAKGKNPFWEMSGYKSWKDVPAELWPEALAPEYLRRILVERVKTELLPLAA